LLSTHFGVDNVNVPTYHRLVSLTDQQIRHREYLQSPVWKQKRQEALAHYGCVCNRCHEYGTDVHHKTYERVGGEERLEDLEVLCRACHEAHHRVERTTQKPKEGKRRKVIARQALIGYLTPTQKQQLKREFGVSLDGELVLMLMDGSPRELLTKAHQMLGCDDSYVARKGRSMSRSQKRVKDNVKFFRKIL
jgi:5-methylcytosine-specific restriction endonuclease McrA